MVLLLIWEELKV